MAKLLDKVKDFFGGEYIDDEEYDEYDDSAYGVIQLNDLSIHERYVNVWFFYADGG